ncbi:hypothetical protein WDU94_005936 [Cyamophila willieti]
MLMMIDSQENLNSEYSDLSEKDENPSADDSNEIQSTILDKRAKCKETVRSFCENVLKSLLCHIRLSEISTKMWMASFQTEWFKKYSDYLGNEDYFSQSSKPRQKYVAVTSVKEDVGNVANDQYDDCGPLMCMSRLIRASREAEPADPGLPELLNMEALGQKNRTAVS